MLLRHLDCRTSQWRLLAIVARLEVKEVSLRVLSQPLDTSTSTGRLMLAVIGAVGQAERELHAGAPKGGYRQGQARRSL